MTKKKQNNLFPLSSASVIILIILIIALMIVGVSALIKQHNENRQNPDWQINWCMKHEPQYNATCNIPYYKEDCELVEKCYTTHWEQYKKIRCPPFGEC